MEYTFNYKDNRDYKQAIDGDITVKAVSSTNDKTKLQILSTKKKHIQLILDRNEAIAISHSILSTIQGGCNASIKVVN